MSYRSAHSLTLLDLNFTEIKRGKCLWKFNISLLYDIDYINSINEKIEDIILQYCLPIYNQEFVVNMERSQIQFVINDQLFIETLLMAIREKTISFSSHKCKEATNGEKFLVSEILELEKSLDNHYKEKLIRLQNELEEIRKENLFYAITFEEDRRG